MSGGEEEHAIPVTEEMEFCLDGLLVGGEDFFAGAEAADEHEEGGLREVEIGEESVGDFWRLWGIEEDARASAGGLDEAGAWDGAAFQSAHGGCAHAEDSFALAVRLIDEIGGFL